MKMARGSDAVAQLLSSRIAEFEATFDAEDLSPMRRAKIVRAAQLVTLAEITRANALSGEATIASVVAIEELAEKAKKEAGIYE